MGNFGEWLQPALPSGAITSADRSAALSNNERRRKKMAEARTRIADHCFANQPVTLAVLRMRAGLSQTEVASAIGTKQPNVSRMESGVEDVRADTLHRLANVFKTTMDQVYEAIQASRKQRKETET